MDPGPSRRCQATGQKATDRNPYTGVPLEYEEELLYGVGDHALEQTAPPKDIPELSGWNPVPCALG